MRPSTAFSIILYLTLGFLALGHVICTKELEHRASRETILAPQKIHPDQRTPKRANASPKGSIRIRMFDLKDDIGDAKVLGKLADINGGIIIEVITNKRVYEVAIDAKFLNVVGGNMGVENLRQTDQYKLYAETVSSDIEKRETEGNWLSGPRVKGPFCGKLATVVTTSTLPNRSPSHRFWALAISSDFGQKFDTNPILGAVQYSSNGDKVRLYRRAPMELELRYGKERASVCLLDFDSGKAQIAGMLPSYFSLLDDDGERMKLTSTNLEWPGRSQNEA